MLKNYPNVRLLLFPALLFCFFLFIYIFHDVALSYAWASLDVGAISKLSAASVYFSGAWLLSRIIGAAFRRESGRRRRAPKLLRELITAALFLAATVATIATMLGQSTGGALASSGLIIAVLGFAIRNVLADVLSGIALGLEAPFKIGDWVEIDGEIRGRVIEIGWRTTRLHTRNEIYMILPNSQISRQIIINYSAPKKHYRAGLDIVLGHDISVREGKELLISAVKSADMIMDMPKPDVRALSYDADGIRYAVRFFVPSFLDEIDCKDKVLSAVDEAIRLYGLPAPYKRLKLVMDEGKESVTSFCRTQPSE